MKVTVDAYDGTMTYYADLTDPIIQVWDRAFPELFTPIAEAGDELRSHFRYPENLFQVQASQFARYHVSEASVFYQNQDRWEIAPDPTQQPVTGTTTEASLSAEERLRPYYLLMRAPGEDDRALPARAALRAPGTPEHGGLDGRELRSRQLRTAAGARTA